MKTFIKKWTHFDVVGTGYGIMYLLYKTNKRTNKHFALCELLIYDAEL